MGITRAEMETIYRWDAEERRLHLYTAYEPEAKRWRRLGFAVQDRTSVSGEVTGWQALGPVEAISLRRVGHDGQIVKRRVSSASGKRFGAVTDAAPRVSLDQKG